LLLLKGGLTAALFYLGHFYFFAVIGMIYIEKSEQTKVALTLTESSQLLDPIFIFHITGVGVDDLFTLADESGYPERFNLFTFDLDYPKAEYTYKVYETNDPQWEDLSDTTGIVLEEGIMVVHSNEPLTSVYL
jgi:hypothetical protein